MNRIPPPSEVLEAFRLTGDIAPTHTQDVWRVDSVALKRVEHHGAVEWVSTLLANKKQPDSFRISFPIASLDGEWIVDGWAATTWIPGEKNGARWRDLLDTGAEFHDWLSDVERPAWIDQVDDPWRASDRMAWDEQPVAVRSEFTLLVEELASLRRPIQAAGQLVHGDLAGNVLFSDGLPPGINDLTLYWRPPYSPPPSWRSTATSGRVRGLKSSTTSGPCQTVTSYWYAHRYSGSCGPAWSTGPTRSIG